jgi:hypothetical protein
MLAAPTFNQRTLNNKSVPLHIKPSADPKPPPLEMTAAVCMPIGGAT